MPLVEFALARLWELRDEHRRVLSHAALDAIGGLAGALAHHAEEVLAALLATSGPEGVSVAGELLLALTTPHGTRATRRRDDLARDVPHPLRESVLDLLEGARLVVIDDGRATLAHEALIGAWPRLGRWVASLRRERETVRDIEEAAARWHVRSEQELLLRGSPLRDALALSQVALRRMSPASVSYVRVSRRQARWTTGLVVAVAASVLVGTATLGALYVHDTKAAARQADDEKREALRLYRTMEATRDQPAAEKRRQLDDLVAARAACAKALTRCLGDAAAPPPPDTADRVDATP